MLGIGGVLLAAWCSWVLLRPAIDARLAARFTDQVQQLLEERTPQDREGVQAGLQALCRTHDVQGAELRVDDTRWSVGGKPSNGVVHTAFFAFHPEGPEQALRSAELTLYLTALADGMGERWPVRTSAALGLVLGLALLRQWWRDRRPSRALVEMAYGLEEFARGKLHTRLDARREGVYGHLARRINEALENLVARQAELHQALERVRESEVALSREKERAVVALHCVGEGVVITDHEGRVDYLNPVAERLTGCTLDQVLRRPAGELLRVIDELTRKAFPNPVDTCLRDGREVARTDHLALVRADGEEIPIAASAAPIRDDPGKVLGAIVVFNDVGHARKLARQLSFQASHDALTGLYNRREFEQQLQLTIDSARAEGHQHALCYLDLDQFKLVNDTCGHVAGDELLRQLGVLLHGQVRDSDVLARLGGDEFGILLKYCSTARAQELAAGIRVRVKRVSLRLGGAQFRGRREHRHRRGHGRGAQPRRCVE